MLELHEPRQSHVDKKIKNKIKNKTYVRRHVASTKSPGQKKEKKEKN